MNQQSIKVETNSDGTVNRQRREKGRGDKHKRGAAGRWNRPGTAFTTPGNGEVKDDITDDSTKEFLTVTTKNNNTFYIVIDRSATSRMSICYLRLMRMICPSFTDKDSTAAVVTPQPDTSKVVLDETNNEDVDKGSYC